MRSTRLLATTLALGLLLGAGACSRSDPSAEDLRDDLSDALQRGEDGLTEEQADCYAAIIVEEVGRDALNDVDFDDEEPTAAVGGKLGDAAKKAEAECDLPAEP